MQRIVLVNRSRFFLAIMSLLMVTACAGGDLPAAIEPPAKAGRPKVVTTFTPFHELPDSVAGHSFAMLPSRAQEASLAWATYANQIAQALEAHGLRLVQSATGADYAVSFSYAMGWVEIEPATYALGGRTFNVPGRPARASRSNAASDTEPSYSRRLEVTILDVARSRNSGRRAVIYEAEAASSGSNSNIDTVLPYIIKGVFQSWPGESGTPETAEIPMK